MLEERVIPLNKIKVFLLLLGAIGFVILGLWFLPGDAAPLNSPYKEPSKFSNPASIYGCILFGILCGIYGLRKLFDTSPGLVISAQGIFDNSNGVAVGMIPWSDVKSIEENQIRQQRFVSIQLKDPIRYTEKGNIIKKMANRSSMKMCGTPVNISSNALKINYSELVELINKYHQNHISTPNIT